MASHWPHADEDPSATTQEREFVRFWRDMPKLVYSRADRWAAKVDRKLRVQVFKTTPRSRTAVVGLPLHGYGFVDVVRRLPLHLTTFIVMAIWLLSTLGLIINRSLETALHRVG
jgi:hypothetical protein